MLNFRHKGPRWLTVARGTFYTRSKGLHNKIEERAEESRGQLYRQGFPSPPAPLRMLHEERLRRRLD